MKKLFLLLAAGLTVAAANAQQSASVMLSGGRLAAPTTTKHAVNSPALQQAHDRLHKGTATQSSWFNFYESLYTDGLTNTYYFNIYTDSNLYDDVNSDYTFFHGMGVSFDPTDSAFYSSTVNPDALISFPVTDTNAYTIDSVYTLGQYFHSANYTDSLVFELTIAKRGDTTHGTFGLQFAADPSFASITADETPRFVSPIYNNAINGYSDSVTQPVRRIAIALDPVNDTANGSVFLVPVTPALSVPAGYKVAMYVHFISGHAYPLGTTLENANYMHFYAGQPFGQDIFAPQSSSNTATGYPGSYQAGLISTNQNYYSDTSFDYHGHNLFIPDVAYTTSPGFDAPDMGLHLTCDNCTLGVAKVTSNVKSISAYPSPAISQVNVMFALGTAANTTVTLTNALGQVVATQAMGNVNSGKASFTTSGLANGIYFYTVTANGQRSTGRVLIAH